MKFEFTTSMFTGLSTYPTNREIAARLANEALQAHLKTLPRVYKNHCSNAVWFPNEGTEDAHTAILFDVQEIKKCEKHEPLSINDGQMHVCKHCSVPLRAVWEVCK